jgi:hypothetical protein
MIYRTSIAKFFLLNAVRGFSMLSLLLVFIANILIMVQDVQAMHHQTNATAVVDEECEYIGASSIPDQTTGIFRAFLIITLNLIEIVVLFLSETGFPASFFQKCLPCLDNENNLVALGVLQLLLAAQMMSHFLEPFPLVASFFLLFAGLFNLPTIAADRPKYFRSYEFWKSTRVDTFIKTLESGQAYPSSHYTASAAASMFNEKQQTPASEGYGFARQDASVLSRNPSNQSSAVRASSPPTYSPPKRPGRAATTGRAPAL